MSFDNFLWIQCWVMGYLRQLGIACCIYKTSPMVPETKRLVKTNVCHLCETHTPKVTTTSAIFQSADGRIGNTVCDRPAYRTRFNIINRVEHWIPSCTVLNTMWFWRITPSPCDGWVYCVRRAISCVMVQSVLLVRHASKVQFSFCRQSAEYLKKY
jgi:hypothetical protein